jgi:hypothetical protein
VTFLYYIMALLYSFILHFQLLKKVNFLTFMLHWESTTTLQMVHGPSWLWSYGSWIYNYLCNQCISPLMLWVRISIRARCTTLRGKVCQWLATGWCFFPCPTVSSTNKTDRHDITEILLKVALNTVKQTSYGTLLLKLLWLINWIITVFHVYLH